MSFLDTIRDRLRGGGNDYYDDEEYYDEGYDDEGRSGDRPRRREGSSNRLLGTTPRPEAESVSVYTRSGRPVSTRPQGRAGSDASSAGGSMSSYDLGSQPTADISVGGAGRLLTAQLPAYVLRPVSYDDVQTVVQRVRTNQPVVVSFRNTSTDTARRILDFCFGFSCGVGGSVSEIGERVFAVLPAGSKLTATDLDKLAANGDLNR